HRAAQHVDERCRGGHPAADARGTAATDPVLHPGHHAPAHVRVLLHGLSGGRLPALPRASPAGDVRLRRLAGARERAGQGASPEQVTSRLEDGPRRALVLSMSPRETRRRTGCGAAWKRTSLGLRGSWVRIPPARPRAMQCRGGFPYGMPLLIAFGRRL